MTAVPRALSLALLTLAGSALAQAADPLRSPACLAALDVLQSAEQAVVRAAKGTSGQPADGPVLARIHALRKRAAGECLGAWMDDPPQAVRTVQPPIRVTPVTATGASRPPVPTPTSSPASATADRAAPARIVSCDVAGCTDSAGNRLPRAARLLVTPQGVCPSPVVGQVCP